MKLFLEFQYIDIYYIGNKSSFYSGFFSVLNIYLTTCLVNCCLILYNFPEKDEFRKTVVIKEIPILDSKKTEDFRTNVILCMSMFTVPMALLRIIARMDWLNFFLSQRVVVDDWHISIDSEIFLLRRQ